MTSGLWTSGWTAALLNHLWQSTAVAVLVWLLTLALRNNSARVRYAIWLFASVKFLVPFQLLTSVGARLSKPVGSNGAQLYFIVEEFTRPIRQAPIAASQSAAPASPMHSWSLPWTFVAAVWLCGFVVLLLKWISGWRSASRMAAAAEPMSYGREFDALSHACGNVRISSPIRLLLSAAGMEPGIFGIVRPVLLWPAGLSERLDDAQIETIMAHEIEHVRRRDNLTSAIHSLVEALFWFHPLVRWMSTQLSEERERACDERVIEQNARPEAYAESILKVCSFCVEPAIACVSGVSGADLKKRILRIMTQPSGTALSVGRKCLLYAAGLLLIAAPLGFGVLHGQSAPAASSDEKGYAWTPDLPKYEVASIKPSPEDSRLMLMMRPTGIEMKSAQVQMLLQLAFGVEPDRIVGAPDWVRSRRYDIEAKVTPEDAPKLEKLKMELRRAMLLPVLEERFGLKYHHESRELPMYALVVAKGGPKLTESKPGEGMPGPDGHTAPPGGPMPPPGGPGLIARPDGPPREGGRPVIGEGMRMTPGSIQSRGGTTAFLAHALSGMLGRTVVDETGLTGNYDFSLNWTPDEGMRNVLGGPQGGPPRDDAPSDAGGPTLFSAVEEQLGLKLQSEKGKVDVIVIDHIDLPTEN
jgi:bla regulator protein BlaR1